MRGIVIAFSLIIFAVGQSVAQKKLVFEGNFQGKNIYVQNPFKDGGVGFCTNKVTVNGDVTSDEINSSAFEIDFSKLGLKVGEEVVVVIEHGSDCVPKVLNPEVLKPTSTCKWESVEVTDGGLVKWTTSGETGQLPYIVEIYNWNKWIPVGEIEGKGTPEKHTYEFQLTPHSGENKVRIKQIDHTKRPNISPTRTFRDPSIEEVQFSPKKVKNNITFTAKTRYEIYDAYGNIVKKGYGTEIDAKNLTDGAYYLNFDNRNEKFLKK